MGDAIAIQVSIIAFSNCWGRRVISIHVVNKNNAEVLGGKLPTRVVFEVNAFIVTNQEGNTKKITASNKPRYMTCCKVCGFV
jgi:hypothetical protein